MEFTSSSFLVHVPQNFKKSHKIVAMKDGGKEAMEAISPEIFDPKPHESNYPVEMVDISPGFLVFFSSTYTFNSEWGGANLTEMVKPNLYSFRCRKEC